MALLLYVVEFFENETAQKGKRVPAEKIFFFGLRHPIGKRD